MRGKEYLKNTRIPHVTTKVSMRKTTAMRRPQRIVRRKNRVLCLRTPKFEPNLVLGECELKLGPLKIALETTAPSAFRKGVWASCRVCVIYATTTYRLLLATGTQA